MFEPTFGFKNSQYSQFKEYNYRKICNPPHFYLPTQEKFALPHTSQDLAENLSSDQLWVPLLYAQKSPGQ